METMSMIEVAIKNAGGTTALARQLSANSGKRVLHSTVHKWAKIGRVPAHYCIAIENATGVSRYELRPDVFGVNPADIKKRNRRNNDD